MCNALTNWPKFYILIVARIILLPLVQYFIFNGISNYALWFCN